MSERMAVGSQHAFYLATAGLLVGLLVSLALPRKATGRLPVEAA